MILLFDKNLSPNLMWILHDVLPGSAHLRDLRLQSSPDRAVWDFAARFGDTVVSNDADFRQRSFLYGYPPKVIWIRLGLCSTRQIGELLRDRQDHVETFCLAITDTQVRDGCALSRLAEEGKLSFVQQTINAPGHRVFKMPASGASTEHRLQGKVDTRGLQESFGGTRYEYTVTSQAQVQPTN